MKKILAMSSMLVVANAALASTVSHSYTPFDGREPNPDPGHFVTDQGRTGVLVPFNVAGIQSWDLVGSPNNTVVLFDAAAALGLPAGSPVTMNGVSWDVTLATEGQSWLSEMRVYFDDAVNPDLSGLFLRPGVSQANPGTGTFSSNGILKFNSVNPPIPDIVLPNGILRMEFHETFDDVAGAVDGNWVSGTLGLQFVPEPASLSLLALGALALIRRR